MSRDIISLFQHRSLLRNFRSARSGTTGPGHPCAMAFGRLSANSYISFHPPLGIEFRI